MSVSLSVQKRAEVDKVYLIPILRSKQQLKQGHNSTAKIDKT